MTKPFRFERPSQTGIARSRTAFGSTHPSFPPIENKRGLQIKRSRSDSPPTRTCDRFRPALFFVRFQRTEFRDKNLHATVPSSETRALLFLDFHTSFPVGFHRFRSLTLRRTSTKPRTVPRADSSVAGAISGPARAHPSAMTRSRRTCSFETNKSTSAQGPLY